MKLIKRSALIASASIGLFAREAIAQAVPAAAPGYLLVIEEGGYPSGEYPYGPPPARYMEGAALGTSLIFDGISSAQETVSLTGSPSITAVVYTNPASASGGNALAVVQLSYYFEIEGPPGSEGVGVPVDFSATLTGTASGYSQALADIDINSGELVSIDTTGDDSDDYFGVLGIESGTVYKVGLNATAGTLGGTSTATIDPTITIDPTFLSENPDYSIVFSAGVTQGSSVPDGGETAAFFGGAFASLAALRRRFAT